VERANVPNLARISSNRRRHSAIRDHLVEFCGRNSDVHRGLVTGQTAAGKWTHLGEGARHLPTRKLGYGSLEIVQAVAERPERRLVVLAVDGDIAGRAHDRSCCPLIPASKFPRPPA